MAEALHSSHKSQCIIPSWLQHSKASHHLNLEQFRNALKSDLLFLSANPMHESRFIYSRIMTFASLYFVKCRVWHRGRITVWVSFSGVGHFPLVSIIGSFNASAYHYLLDNFMLLTLSGDSLGLAP